MNKLFALIFQHSNYGGQYRWIRSSIANFSDKIGFNDTVSSIIVYRGNDYAPGDKMRFHQHVNYEGGYLDLGPGWYPNIHIQPYSFGDKISSVTRVVDPEGGMPKIMVRLMIRIYQHVNYGGQYRDVLKSENNLNDIGFNDTVSSIKVFAGEDYSDGWVCDFFQHANYEGGMLSPGKFGPGTRIPNIKKSPYSFNDVISSVRFRKRS